MLRLISPTVAISYWYGLLPIAVAGDLLHPFPADVTGVLKCFPGANTSLVIQFVGNETMALSLSWAGESWSMPGKWSHPAAEVDHFRRAHSCARAVARTYSCPWRYERRVTGLNYLWGLKCLKRGCMSQLKRHIAD